MKTLTLQRPKEKFNKNCSYEILVDGNFVTCLNNGETKTVAIPNDAENLQARLQWCGSQNLSLGKLENQNNIIVAGDSFLNQKMYLIIVPILLLFLILSSPGNETLRNLEIGIIVLLMLGVLGTLTIWRKKWIRLITS